MLRKTLFLSIMVTLMAVAFDGCAAGPNDRVMHAFELGVDPSLAAAKNIRYRYGELGEKTKAGAAPIGAPFAIWELEMIVPDDFEISWETPDGESHKTTVPVRSRLTTSVKGKALLFLISHDEVHGYVVIETPKGEQREQFY